MENKDAIVELKHGKTLFPIGIYHQEINTLLLHWHPHFEISYVEKGEVEINVNLEKYKVYAGDIIIVPCKALHSAEANKNTIVKMHTIVFTIDLLQSGRHDVTEPLYLTPLKNNEITFPVVIRKEDNCYDEVKNVFFDIIKCVDGKADMYELLTKSKLYYLLYVLFNTFKSNLKSEDMEEGEWERTKKIIEYIDNNYNRELTVEEVAKTFNLSTSYFCRKFKKNVGKTFIQFLNFKRIEKATLLLTKSDKSITEISYLVGFQDLSYFIRVFKKYKLASPTNYRKLINSQNSTNYNKNNTRYIEKNDIK